MDFVDGEVIKCLEDPTQIATIAHILNHLASFQRNVPGPLYCGPPTGLLFLDEGEYSFNSGRDLEQWWNNRLLPGEPLMCLQNIKFVLCHLDIAPRNILWKAGEVPCLLDWASASYYPRFFEFCAQLTIEGLDGRFNRLLLEAITKLEETETQQIQPLLQAWSNIQRYNL
jgi:hypothetical protein